MYLFICSACFLFTFHYVSILMQGRSYKTVRPRKFTFHYVSILIIINVFPEIRKGIYIPLCLYFNSKLTCHSSSPFFIYIPLCLYFNPSSPSLFIFFLFHPLSVDLSIAINILPYFSCFFYKIDGKCPIYRVF